MRAGLWQVPKLLKRDTGAAGLQNRGRAVSDTHAVGSAAAHARLPLSPRASGFLLQPSRREIIVARMAVNIVGREAEFACVRAFLERPADGLRALMLVRALKPLNGPS